MKNRHLLLIFFAWLLPVMVWGYDFEAKNDDGVTIYYRITKASPDGNEVEVTYKEDLFGVNDNYTGVIKIPDEVTNSGITYKVTAIGVRAFEFCTGLTSVTIDGNVTKIDDFAFADCRGLISVSIGSNVTSIGYAAFTNCYNLPSIVIGENVTLIGELAFAGCHNLAAVTMGEKVTGIEANAFVNTSLIEIYIPASVSDIGNNAFEIIPLKRISVDPENQNYSSLDGVLYNADKTTLILCPPQIETSSITMPEEVTMIGPGAFNYCSGLTSITLGKNVKTIGTNAFRETSLTEIHLPAEVCNIGECAFLIPTLKRISVDENNQAYSSSGGILYGMNKTILIACPPQIETSSIAMPEEVTMIGPGAFSYCSGLTSITLGEKVTTIGTNAFKNTSLTEITIPASVFYIETDAFTVPTLKRILVDKDNQTYSSPDGILYDKDGETLILCPSQIGMSSITIPDKVTRILNHAFLSCTSLFSVTLGESFNADIADEAFEGCYNLQEIYNYSNKLSLTAGDSGNGGMARYAKVIHTEEGAVSCIKEQGDYKYIEYTEGSEKKAELLKYTGTATVLALPESLSDISSYAIVEHMFMDNRDITSVVIPKAVTTIGMGVFAYCTSLESLISLAENPPAADEYAFYGIQGMIPVYVPGGSIDNYQSAEGWNRFSNMNIKDLGPFSVSVTLNGPAMGSVDISATLVPVGDKFYGGTTLTLQARANSGYHFTGWSDDVTDAMRTITVDQELTLQANFAVDYVPPAPDPVYYSVFLPAIEGAVTDPVSGESQVEAWDNFRFYLTLDEEYNQSNPIVTTDRGETITPRSSDGAYIIKYVRSDVQVYIDGIEKNPDRVANETVEINHSRVWGAADVLHIVPAFDGKLSVYSAAGTLKVLCNARVGEELTFRLPAGVYLVRLGNELFKIII